ncbi:MAG TPA: HAD family hydrolase [Deltaproteobacteria bacterium]|jgi:3-deoxy-D-manno-octulosonate 8-phosphate phosphatase (KDO 8-P phosphatase)|nr:HAD family hydrolase [Deltaproteobacteria bacterium]HQI01060.1 HAD family hydrolase [Deltaproteobacteria bacterium]HQJ09284.1 HAD family hydrolase [Deltaproteobacteria bacterium]
MSAQRIRFLVLDCDGVLTDSKITYTEDGREIKSFNIKDGHGIKLLMRAGIGVAVITGRFSKALEHRAKDLLIEHVIQGAKDKRAALLDFSQKVGVEPSEMAYMGDDVVDLPAMALCAMSIAPGDAVEMVKERSDVITSLAGGHGAVREAAEIILKHLGLFDSVMERYVG